MLPTQCSEHFGAGQCLGSVPQAPCLVKKQWAIAAAEKKNEKRHQMTAHNIVLNYLQLYHKVIWYSRNPCKKNTLQTCETSLSWTEDAVLPGSLQETCGTQGKGVCLGLSYWGLVRRETVLCFCFFKRNLSSPNIAWQKKYDLRKLFLALAPVSTGPADRGLVGSLPRVPSEWCFLLPVVPSAQHTLPGQSTTTTDPGVTSNDADSLVKPVESAVHRPHSSHLDRSDTPSTSVCTGLNDNATHTALHPSISAS